MKKIVPDPPLDQSATTHTVFGSCDAGHSPLFTVCSGIAAHDALVHAFLYLSCAYDTGYKAFGADNAYAYAQPLTLNAPSFCHP